MRFWWVNQNQTYRHEVPGGYLWSPKRNQGNRTNPFYEFMREVAPGDLVFSFCDGLIKAIGIARSYGYESPKPIEFGSVGAYWEQIGWRVDASFQELLHPIRPAAHMDQLAPKLPARYAPIQSNGRGLQSVYLTRLPDPLALALADLIGREAHNLINALRAQDQPIEPVQTGLVEWEQHQLATIATDSSLAETDRKAVILARRGQGLFRTRVMQKERRCRITGVDQLEYLRASHCKPWRDASHEERLDGDNGLLLSPDVDHLFDRGLISFEDKGKVLVSPVAHRGSLIRMGLDPDSLTNAGAFSTAQQKYLEYHRAQVFLQARLRET
ncbi:HNH endonuclease [Ahniella affigens]|uniref:HNH endonuclease n=1 Tax=Ahniella affigens TaxID=2021234 RepID=A0A2P1PRS7_9GAMM|nr:HNH endonuclease [Ahniella affigens]AVP97538.1 HNH endonuclease [Ahniella affigens]